ncbi:MAG: DUF1294 domain-containing protein [Clostridiales bacterium]|nr:DUF1294 domain-containing protein [Clostridiales bacterium]
MAVKIVAMLLIASNLISFAMMGIDKGRAVRGQWRISERALLTAASVFGAAGGLAGMWAFRHKIRDPKFSLGLPALLIVQTAIAAALARRLL